MNSSSINFQRIHIDGNTALTNLKKTYNDQYTCSDCDSVPEISNINFKEGNLEFICQNHGTKVLGVIEYIQKEYKHLYYNIRCKNDNKMQFYNLKNIFNYCEQCSKYFCEKCSTEHFENSPLFIKVNETNSKCYKHLKNYIEYCQDCNMHFCEKDKKCIHKLKIIQKPHDSDIENIQNKINELKNNINIKNYLVILLEGLINTYKFHPSNYFHSINIMNISKIIELENNYEKKLNSINKTINTQKSDSILINKFDQLEKKIFNIIGDEDRLILSKKKINNKLFDQICEIEFKNLKYLNLSKNNISIIEPLEKLISPNLKNINLAYNKIYDIRPFKGFSINNKELEKVDLSFNLIEIVDTFKNKIFPKLQFINFDYNKIIKQDFDEVRSIIEGEQHYKNNKCIMIYSLINIKENKIRIFGEEFVRNNKDNCNIIINDDKKEICEYYEFNNNNDQEKTITVELFMNEKVTNINQLFYECDKLISLSDISYWNTSKINKMEYIFCNCSSLSSLPDISKWDTSNVSKMTGIFSGCISLTNLPNISKWNLSNTDDISYMFANCSSLLSLPDISKWDISNVTSIKGIFSGCSKLSDLPDISNWNTSNVFDMSEMFNQCSSLSILPDISKWNTSNVLDINHMFGFCTSLSKLPDISKWDLNSLIDKNDMFSECDNIKNDIPEQFK